eukprot:237715_1
MSALSTLIMFLFSFFQLSTSTLFIAQGLPGFAIQIDIGPTKTTVTAEVAANQYLLWHGIGFGRNVVMKNRYAIIQLPSGTFTERRLASGAEGEELDSTASNWNIGSDTSSDPHIITMTRDNVGISNKYYTFDPSLTSPSSVPTNGPIASVSPTQSPSSSINNHIRNWYR